MDVRKEVLGVHIENQKCPREVFGSVVDVESVTIIHIGLVWRWTATSGTVNYNRSGGVSVVRILLESRNSKEISVGTPVVGDEEEGIGGGDDRWVGWFKDGVNVER